MLVDEVRRISKLIADAPPTPRAIFASYDVPFDAIYRQWNTLGQLLLWVNRHQIEHAISNYGVRRDIDPHLPAYGIDVFKV